MISLNKMSAVNVYKKLRQKNKALVHHVHVCHACTFDFIFAKKL